MKRLQAIIAWLEDHSRDSERRRLVAELESIDKQRAYIDEREPLLKDRLQQLHKEGFKYVDAKRA